MVNIIAPKNRRLVWYLALEEYIGQHLDLFPDGAFFTWTVEPTVIFGRHQVMEQEVNLSYCHAHSIHIYRRKSGGGCVYADRGNLMLSYITPSVHPEQVFQTYLDTIAGLLTQLGLPAVKSEHNDILVDGKKVSGNACYALKTGTIVHGTMLYDVDFTALEQAITPTQEKLSKHGVQSVRQRVMNLRPLLCSTALQDKELAAPQPISTIDARTIDNINDLAAYLSSSLCPSSCELTEDQLLAISLIEKTYLTPNVSMTNEEVTS